MAVDKNNLGGKVALVSGGSRGIGEAVAHGLAGAGAHVIVSSRKIDSCQKVADDIVAAGGSASALTCHAGKMEDIEAVFAGIAKEHGRLDILINNGGTSPYYGPIADTELWAFDKTIEVNLRGPFFMSAAAVKLMQKTGGGAIVNVASVNAFSPGAHQGIYSITKAALVNMTKSFAREYGADGIRVNALCPGFTDTDMTSIFKENEELLTQTTSEFPIPRMGLPEEMVGAVLYLVSDASSYTTGTTIVVDGGMLA
jgi:NAD(P)-dependent dehydrogenase (short-subunit alcohol dehydrogenase family)